MSIPYSLPYERIDGELLKAAIALQSDEQLLTLHPFGWHLDGFHIPNAPEHYSRDGLCREKRWIVVCDFGPYIAIVRPDRRKGEDRRKASNEVVP